MFEAVTGAAADDPKVLVVRVAIDQEVAVPRVLVLTHPAFDDWRVGHQGNSPAEEWLTAVVFVRATALPSMNPATGLMAQSAMYQTSADQLFALRAPPGELPAHEKLVRTTPGKSSRAAGRSCSRCATESARPGAGLTSSARVHYPSQP